MHDIKTQVKQDIFRYNYARYKKMYYLLHKVYRIVNGIVKVSYTLTFINQFKCSLPQIMWYLKRKRVRMVFESHENLKYKFGNNYFWGRIILLPVQ